MDLNKTLMVEAIRKIHKTSGDSFLSENKLFSALLRDALGDNQKEVKALLRIITDTQVKDMLLEGLRHPGEILRTRQLIKRELEVDFGMSAHNAQFFVDMFSEAFGWMPQRAVKKGMGDIVFFGSNEWIVLRRQNDRALLLAKDITDIGLPYHDKLEAATWENCSLRAWLNTVFLNRFSEKERDRIDRVWQTNERNQWYGGVNGQKTRDGIFLLSIAEVVELFGDSGHLQSRPGNQWIDDRTDESAGSVITDESAGSVITDESAGFVIVQKGESCAIDDQYNERRRAKYRDSYTWWWLRSSGKSNAYAAYVNVGGVISVNGDLIFDDGGNNRMGVKPGVRPALWLMN